jgi:hypothetical protein
MKKQFVSAAKNRCKIKMAIQGPSGSGKTYSALLTAYGLTGDWKKIAVLDTENGSAHLYSDLGDYWVLNMKPPYSPEEYTAAIKSAKEIGVECLIIDTISAEWSGEGGILDIHSNIPGNSFAAWSKVTPRHNAFIQTMLQSDLHIIATMRSKTDYVMNEKNGKQVPEKVGLKAVQREDVEYEFTLVMELSQRHIATISKDRTGLFKNKPELTLTTDTGKLIAQWCNTTSAESSVDEVEVDDFTSRINSCLTLGELMDLFNNNPEQGATHRELFIKRKNQISLTLNNYSSNGVHH